MILPAEFPVDKFESSVSDAMLKGTVEDWPQLGETVSDREVGSWDCDPEKMNKAALREYVYSLRVLINDMRDELKRYADKFGRRNLANPLVDEYIKESK